MITSLFTWMAMSVIIGGIAVLAYTTHVLHKAHNQLAAIAAIATSGGMAPAPAAERHRHRPSDLAPASTEDTTGGPRERPRPARGRERRPWAARARLAVVLIAVGATCWETGYNHHWPALAADAAALLLSAWLTRRWR